MKNLLLSFCLMYSLHLPAQQKNINILFTSDITNFWIAYDSLYSTKDTLLQLNYVKELYLKKATLGLLVFYQSNHLTAQEIRNKIIEYPKFWESIKPYTLQTKIFSKTIGTICNQFRKLYPSFLQPSFYFVIGALKKGGKAQNDIVAIGTELAASNNKVNYSELPNAFKERMQLNKNCSFLIAHECVHIQQNKIPDSTKILLSFSLMEGSADFIAGIITRQTVPAPYISYGKLHEKIIWDNFKKDMYSPNLDKWLWNSRDTSILAPDLGYFVGYAICKSYYENSKNKKKAIQEIIDINYSKLQQVIQFLIKSKYEENLNKNRL